MTRSVPAPFELTYLANPAACDPSLGPRGKYQVIVNGQPAGSISLVANSPRQATIGFEIEPEFRGLGLASGALNAVIAAATNLGLTALSAQCRSDNGASRRVLEKNGFILMSSSPFREDGHDASIQYMLYQCLTTSAIADPEFSHLK